MEDPTLAATLLVAVSVLWVCWKWIYHSLETKRPFPGVPMPDGSHWLLGHLGQLVDGNFRASVAWLKESADQHGHVG